MNWDVIVSAIASAIVSGGGITWIFKIRENKVKAGADVAGASAGAMTQMMKLIRDQQEQFNKIIADKDAIIEQQRQLIEKYKTTLDEANHEISELKWRLSESERKIAGMQEVISKYAEATKKSNGNAL